MHITSRVGWSQFILLADDFKLNITLLCSGCYGDLMAAALKTMKTVHQTSASAAHWRSSARRSDLLKDFISCQTKPDKSAGNNRKVVLRPCYMQRKHRRVQSCRNTLAASGSTERQTRTFLNSPRSHQQALFLCVSAFCLTRTDASGSNGG